MKNPVPKVTIALFITCLLLAGSGADAKKKTMKGASLVPFPENPTMVNLFIKEKAKKVHKVNTICVGTFVTSFIQNSLVGIRIRETFGSGKPGRVAGRRLSNVTRETQQAIADSAYIYSRQALADAGFSVKSDAECAMIPNWGKLKVSSKADGELKKLGI